MTQAALPTRIDRHSPTEMLVEWNQGERYALPFFELRFLCPCAGCVDEHTGERTLKREALASDIRPLGVQTVGRYAVQVSWSDRHETGMYHYDRLLEICRKHG